MTLRKFLPFVTHYVISDYPTNNLSIRRLAYLLDVLYNIYRLNTHTGDRTNIAKNETTAKMSDFTIISFTCPSLSVKWTIHPSLSTLEPVLLVCFTDCTIRISGMLLLCVGLSEKIYFYYIHPLHDSHLCQAVGKMFRDQQQCFWAHHF